MLCLSVEVANVEDKETRTRLMRATEEQCVSDLGVGGAHVELEAVGRLSHHLETALQNANRKAVRGLCCQPQPEVLQFNLHFSATNRSETMIHQVQLFGDGRGMS